MGKEFTKITAAVSRILCNWSLDHISRGSYNDCVDAGEVEEILRQIDFARGTDGNPETSEEGATSDDMRDMTRRILLEGMSQAIPQIMLGPHLRRIAEAMEKRSRIDAIRGAIFGEDFLADMSKRPGVGDRMQRLMKDIETLRSLAAPCESESES